MRIVLIILLFICTTAYSQDYVAKWNSSNHTSYQVQRSTNNRTWTTIKIASAKLTDTAFSFIIPKPANQTYYRIVAGSNQSGVMFIYNLPPEATLTNNKLTIQLPTK